MRAGAQFASTQKLYLAPYEQAKTVVENFLVRVVVDYADTQISNSASKYLRENEKVRETVLPWSEGAQKECFMQNKEDDNLVTLFLSLNWSLWSCCVSNKYNYKFSLINRF